MGDNWYVEHQAKVIGPLSLDKLKTLVRQNRIVSTTRVCRGSAGAWMQAGTVKELFPQKKISKTAPLDQVANPPPAVPQPTAPPPIQVTAAATTHVTAQKHCLYCAEPVNSSARKCRYCGEFLDGRPQRQIAPTVSIQTNPRHVQTIEKTSKRWKGLQLVSVFAMIAFAMFFFIAIGIQEPMVGALSFFAGTAALGVFIFARVGAWWFHG